MKKIEYEWTKKEKEVNVSIEEVADGIVDSYVFENEDDVCDDDISNYLMEEEISGATDEDFDKIGALVRSKVAENLENDKQYQRELLENRDCILRCIEHFIRNDGEDWYLTPEEILNEILKTEINEEVFSKIYHKRW